MPRKPIARVDARSGGGRTGPRILVAKFDTQPQPAAGRAPLTVRFHYKTKGEVGKWHWSFGDRRRSSAKNPIHTYPHVGVYNACLTVTNQWGSSRACQNILVFSVAYELGQHDPNLIEAVPSATLL